VTTFTNKLPLALPGVTSVLPWQVWNVVAGSAVVNVVYSSPSLKLVWPEAESWHLFVAQLELKRALTAA
jgi:hypothetical protein